MNSHEVIISDSLKEDLQESCILTNAFDGISTRATRECYYRKHFHYVVSLTFYTSNILKLNLTYIGTNTSTFTQMYRVEECLWDNETCQ